MARAAWRDALDGKIKIIRDLQHPVSQTVIQEYIRAGLAYRGTRFTDVQLMRTAQSYQRSLVYTLREAEPFFLSNDMIQYFIRQSAVLNVDRVLTREDLPVTNGVFWFPGPVQVTDEDGTQGDTPGHSLWVRAVGFGVARQGTFNPQYGLVQREDGKEVLGIVLFTDAARSGFPGVPPGVLVPFLYQPFDLGGPFSGYIARATQIYRTSFDLAHQLWGVMFLLAAFDALQQKIVRFGGSGIERSLRKQAERANVSPVVQIMEWRKAIYRYPEGHVPASVDWSCRWAVRSHARRLKSGKVVHVRPYVKGPTDKPFREQRERIHLVDR